LPGLKRFDSRPAQKGQQGKQTLLSLYRPTGKYKRQKRLKKQLALGRLKKKTGQAPLAMPCLWEAMKTVIYSFAIILPN
jgi:hypothetical protein